MNDDDSAGGKSRNVIQRLLSNTWVFAVILTLLGVLAVYMSASVPTVRKLAAGGVFGAAVGIAYLLELRLATSTFALRLLCAVVGAVTGYVMCLLLSVSTTGVLLGVLLGGALGATSKDWIGHTNFP